MTTSPTALPIARLRAAGCRVATTYGHTPTSPRHPFWSYVVTFPDGTSNRAEGPNAATVAAHLTETADHLTPDPTEAGDVTTPTGGPAPCTNGAHDWMLTEDGYTRCWSTEIDDDGTITATYGGTEDWSEDGSGVYLSCTRCAARQDVDGEDVVYD